MSNDDYDYTVTNEDVLETRIHDIHSDIAELDEEKARLQKHIDTLLDQGNKLSELISEVYDGISFVSERIALLEYWELRDAQAEQSEAT